MEPLTSQIKRSTAVDKNQTSHITWTLESFELFDQMLIWKNWYGCKLNFVWFEKSEQYFQTAKRVSVVAHEDEDGTALAIKL